MTAIIKGVMVSGTPEEIKYLIDRYNEEKAYKENLIKNLKLCMR